MTELRKQTKISGTAFWKGSKQPSPTKIKERKPIRNYANSSREKILMISSPNSNNLLMKQGFP